MNSTWSKVVGGVLTLGLTGMAIGFLIAMVEEAHTIRDPTPAFGMVAGAVIFGVLFRGPVGRAIAKMLDGGTADDSQLVSRFDHVEDRVADLSLDQHRIAELEERLDFAERLLAQRDSLGALQKPER
ncbi:MAG TPA: hypothetical protein VGM20_03715 [Gemmatimonadales bacterium]|jgi:hypothetical protein